MIRRLALTCLTLLATAVAADAHGLTVTATAHAGELRVAAAYDTGEPAGGAAVTVVASGGRVVADGLTDAAGTWAAALPPPGEYRVRVDDGLGHGRGVTVVIEASGELPPAAAPWPRWLKIGIGITAIAGLTALARVRARVAGGLPPTGPPPAGAPPAT